MSQNSLFTRGVCFYAVLCVLCVSLLCFTACGPSYTGTIEVVKKLIDKPASATALYEEHKLLYVAEGNKLVVYDLSKPEDPKRIKQIDAFEGPHLSMTIATWLVLIGTNGTMGIFSIDDPKSPKPLWGRNKFLKLPVKTGPYVFRSDLNVLYMTLDNTAIVRVALNALNVVDFADAEKNLPGAVSKIPGTGGGGIVMPFDKSNIPVRIYIGRKDKNQIDIWRPDEIEKFAGVQGGSPPKPSATLATKFKVQNLFGYERVNAKDNFKRFYLIANAVGAGAEGSEADDMAVFSLERNWTKAGEPILKGSAKVGQVFYTHKEGPLFVSKTLDIWDGNDLGKSLDERSAPMAKPVAFAKPDLLIDLQLRDLVVYKDFIYTAESSGVRVYKFGKK